MTALDRLLAEAHPDGTFGGSRPAPQPARSTCAWCGHSRALTDAGRFWPHRKGDDPCPGSGRRPRTHPATAARHRAALLADLRTRKAA
ncbi:hypothetical protein ACFY7H_13215 [Streptomyces sp. NPDC012794]|uniref:hypothetical protein n=1 Tax=Streptomyces sp. NPDC012794 TaxID=3364850 RepID=UPI0036800240